MCSPGFRAAALTAVLFGGGVAWAGAVDVELRTKVAQGSVPKVRVVASESVAGVSLTLTRDDGKKFNFNLGRMGDGASRELSLGGEPGRHRYRGKLVAGSGESRQETELEFDAVVAPPLEVQVDKTKVDLKEGRLELRMSRPAGKVEFKVVSETGAVIADESTSFVGKEGGAPLELTWSPRKGETVGKIELRAYDVDDFFTGLVLVPWSVHIPHEEVSFRTDSADIDASERPKLDASFTKVTDALAKYKELGAIKLFIAGHTDTVGGDAYNLALSQRRAQSIGAWFRKRGLRIPIASEGFGERALLQKTADNVDEPRNRRVDYILSVEEPALRATGYQPVWRRVP